MTGFRLNKEILLECASKYDIIDNTIIFLKSRYALKVPIEYIVSLANSVLPNTNNKGVRSYYGGKTISGYSKKMGIILQYYICALEVTKMKQIFVDLEYLSDVDLVFRNGRASLVIKPKLQDNIIDKIKEYDDIIIYSKHINDDFTKMTMLSIDEIIKLILKKLTPVYGNNLHILPFPVSSPNFIKGN